MMIAFNGRGQPEVRRGAQSCEKSPMSKFSSTVGGKGRVLQVSRKNATLVLLRVLVLLRGCLESSVGEGWTAIPTR